MKGEKGEWMAALRLLLLKWRLLHSPAFSAFLSLGFDRLGRFKVGVFSVVNHGRFACFFRGSLRSCDALLIPVCHGGGGKTLPGVERYLIRFLSISW